MQFFRYFFIITRVLTKCPLKFQPQQHRLTLLPLKRRRRPPPPPPPPP